MLQSLLSLLLLLSAPPFGECERPAHGPVHEAIERLDKKIRLHPDSANLYLQRGQFHAKDDNFHAAYCDYHTARKLRPDWDTPRLMKARLFAQFDYPELALSYANRYLLAHPEDVRGLLTRAEAHTLLGEDAAAVADFERLLAATRRPKPQYYIQIAEAVLRADSTDYDRATAWLDKGEERLGFNIALKSRRIDLDCERGHYPAALRQIDALLPHFSRKEKWLIQKAGIHELMGEPKAAYALYNEAFVAIQGLPPKYRGTDAAVRMEGRAMEGIIRLQEHAGE